MHPIEHIQSFAIGKPYPAVLPSEGVFVRFSSSGIEVVFAISCPDDYERGCFKAGHPTRIGIAKHNRLGALLFNFGDGFTPDAPFDAGIEPPENIPAFASATAPSRVPLQLSGVDASTGEVFGLRFVTLSPRVSQIVIKQIIEQAGAPLTLSDYHRNVEVMYSKYPTAARLAATALANDWAGDRSQDTASIGWPSQWGQPELLDSGEYILRQSGLSVEDVLAAILAGDYGLLNGDADDYSRNHLAREQGRRFIAVFELEGGVLYCAVNENGRTIICSFSDR